MANGLLHWWGGPGFVRLTARIPRGLWVACLFEGGRAASLNMLRRTCHPWGDPVFPDPSMHGNKAPETVICYRVVAFLQAIDRPGVCFFFVRLRQTPESRLHVSV
jgi:hypothetical protein